MAKFAGLVGYVTQKESESGVWLPETVERKMRGDVIRAASSFNANEKVNEDIVMQQRISLVGDPYAFANFATLKYVTYLGVKWKVMSIDVNSRPRLIVTIGGVWNG